MADVAIFEPGKTPKYLTSVNTLDYLTGIPPSKDQAQNFAKANVVINPDISLVKNIPIKYWKRNGNGVAEMTTNEKKVIDDAELEDKKSRANSFAASQVEIFTALIKVINIRLPNGQKITKQELVDAIKEEVT